MGFPGRQIVLRYCRPTEPVASKGSRLKGSISPLSQGASSSASGATAALAGYEYQLNVSVLAALRLLLITKSATRITLEPANEEDLEADLAPDQLGRVVPSANLASGYKLVVQVE